MKHCPCCGYTDGINHVQFGGCFDCMREGCHVCLPRRYEDSNHTCNGCGPIIKAAGIKKMLDLACQRCAGMRGEGGIKWVKTHSVVSGGALESEAICDQCWDKHAQELHEWYEGEKRESAKE